MKYEAVKGSLSVFSACYRSFPPPLGRNKTPMTGGLEAGTPDAVAPVPVGPEILGHFVNDIEPYYDYKRARLVKSYLAYRPPSNGNGCPPRVIRPP